MKKSQLVLFAALTAQIWWSSGSATPAISSVEIVGPLVTVRGSGFGSKSSAAPKLYDTVTNQQAYRAFSDGIAVPHGNSFPFAEESPLYPNSVVFSALTPRSPSNANHYRTKNYHGFLGWPVALGGTNSSPDQTELYVSFWFRPNGDIDGTSHSSKFIRIWDDYNGRGTRISWTQMHMTYPVAADVGTANNSGVKWGDWGGTAGSWNRLEMFVSAETGVIRAWTNGKLRIEASNFVKNTSFPSKGLSVGLIGWNPGGSTPPKVDSDFGGIYIDTTQARVEICDQSTWVSCARKEVQIAKTWSDGSVSFEIDKGIFHAAPRLFLYVVDSRGAANANGVVLSSKVDAPGSPTGLVVN